MEIFKNFKPHYGEFKSLETVRSRLGFSSVTLGHDRLRLELPLLPFVPRSLACLVAPIIDNLADTRTPCRDLKASS
jgi:hypothetical protein